jgi:HEAT repeat protein
MGLFGPPDVEKARATGKIEVMLQATRYKRDPAVVAAGREALKEHLDLLIRELDSRSIRRLKVAREALVAIGPPARDRLVFILGEGHLHRRQDAAFVLGEMKDEQAVGPLCDSLRHTDPLLRLLSVQALGKIGSPKAIRQVRLACMDEDPKVAKDAQKALARIPGGRPGSGA